MKALWIRNGKVLNMMDVTMENLLELNEKLKAVEGESIVLWPCWIIEKEAVA